MAWRRKLFGPRRPQTVGLLESIVHVRDRVATDSDFVPNMTMAEFVRYMDAKTGHKHFPNRPVTLATRQWNAALDAMGYPKNVNHSDLNG